jgi:hypothetical protein
MRKRNRKGKERKERDTEFAPVSLCQLVPYVFCEPLACQRYKGQAKAKKSSFLQYTEWFFTSASFNLFFNELSFSNEKANYICVSFGISKLDLK